jgi:hypothetical protein
LRSSINDDTVQVIRQTGAHSESDIMVTLMRWIGRRR